MRFIKKPIPVASALLSLGVLAGILAGCSANAQTTSTTSDNSLSVPTPSQPSSSAAAAVEDEDRDASWDAASSTAITLEGSSASVSGGGASVSRSTVTISAAGTYVVSGTLDDGEIVIEAGKDDLVRLVLNGADITSKTTAPVHATKVGKLVVILADGTNNTLTDANEYQYVSADEDEPDAALFCKDDLTINGTGSLVVNANYNNGIGAKDNLLFVSGSITVTAVNHAIRGRDSLTVIDGTFDLAAGNDGLQSNNSTDNTVGWISISGGDFTINSTHDAIQAESSLTISDGSFNITAGGGANATPTTTADDDSDSYKGVKAGGDLVISGGTFSLDCADDAVHANGNATISGGEFEIATGDDGMHADGDLLITGGTIDISQSYEGLEGATVTVRDGYISLKASDDGINAAGGTDSNTESGGGFGRDNFRNDVSEDYVIRFEGGTVIIDADGDGFDSNGSVYMSGGDVLVHGPTSGGDGAIDYEIEFGLEGGTLVAVGSSGMAMAPTASVSTQPTLMVYYTSSQQAGDELMLRDESGNELLSFTSNKTYQTAVISMPELQDGGTYTLTSGSTSTNITLDGMLTTVSDTGEAVSGGMMGGFGGGMGGGVGGGQGGRGGMGTPPDGMKMPDDFDFDNFELPEGMELPDDFDPENIPDGFEPPSGDNTGGRTGQGRPGN